MEDYESIVFNETLTSYLNKLSSAEFDADQLWNLFFGDAETVSLEDAVNGFEFMMYIDEPPYLYSVESPEIKDFESQPVRTDLNGLSKRKRNRLYARALATWLAVNKNVHKEDFSRQLFVPFHQRILNEYTRDYIRHGDPHTYSIVRTADEIYRFLSTPGFIIRMEEREFLRDEEEGFYYIVKMLESSASPFLYRDDQNRVIAEFCFIIRGFECSFNMRRGVIEEEGKTQTLYYTEWLTKDYPPTLYSEDPKLFITNLIKEIEALFSITLRTYTFYSFLLE